MNVAVIGASGYVGAELINLLTNHNKISIAHLLVSENSSSEGLLFSDLHAKYQGVCDLPLQAFSPAWFDQHIKNAATPIDAVFFATPHEYSAEWANIFLEVGVKVFDLSGGFRLKDAADYPTYYGFEHHNLSALEQAKYGLAEWLDESFADSNIVAVPGCYPTASQLAIKPLVFNNILTDDVIAKKALVLLKNNLVAARLVYRDYEKTFGKVGDTIRLKLPFRTKSASGRTLVKQPLVDQTIPFAINWLYRFVASSTFAKTKFASDGYIFEI